MNKNNKNDDCKKYLLLELNGGELKKRGGSMGEVMRRVNQAQQMPVTL